MNEAIEETAAASRPVGTRRGLSFIVIVCTGIASWAVLLAGLHYAWAAIRSFLT